MLDLKLAAIAYIDVGLEDARLLMHDGVYSSQTAVTAVVYVFPHRLRLALVLGLDASRLAELDDRRPWPWHLALQRCHRSLHPRRPLVVASQGGYKILVFCIENRFRHESLTTEGMCPRRSLARGLRKLGGICGHKAKLAHLRPQ